jgi:serine/threonine-protein kinase HipA
LKRASADEVDPPRDLSNTSPAAGLVEKRPGIISELSLVARDEMESPNKSNADLAHAIRRYCLSDAIRASNRELFERLVFNIFVLTIICTITDSSGIPPSGVGS